jgi:predicted outer membrane protein
LTRLYSGPPTRGPAGTRIALKTEDFIKALSYILEIDAAKIAQQKGDPQEKTFAGEMITDHTKTQHRVEEDGVRGK